MDVKSRLHKIWSVRLKNREFGGITKMTEIGFYESIEDELPERWTFPDIQPHLINEAKRRGYL